jgi:predicted acylesterase/phospholipase RssA
VRLSPDKPLSLALGAGGVRGLAHIGVLEVLAGRGFRVAEMVGTSVGALILAFYAAVGMDLSELRRLGLNLTSRHLLAWAWLRRAPEFIRRQFAHRAGTIPESIRRLTEASDKFAATRALHHGVERIGITCYDRNRREEVLFHSLQDDFPLADAARGAAAIPGFFPARRCVVGGRVMRLVDGGVVNRLPVDKLFAPPFTPAQVLAVDISNTAQNRAENLAKIAALRRAQPGIPVEVIAPDTFGRGTVLYRRRELQELIDAGRAAAEALLSRRP